jgi:hypothetical protein
MHPRRPRERRQIQLPQVQLGAGLARVRHEDPMDKSATLTSTDNTPLRKKQRHSRDTNVRPPTAGIYVVYMGEPGRARPAIGLMRRGPPHHELRGRNAKPFDQSKFRCSSQNRTHGRASSGKSSEAIVRVSLRKTAGSMAALESSGGFTPVGM